MKRPSPATFTAMNPRHTSRARSMRSRIAIPRPSRKPSETASNAERATAAAAEPCKPVGQHRSNLIEDGSLLSRGFASLPALWWPLLILRFGELVEQCGLPRKLATIYQRAKS